MGLSDAVNAMSYKAVKQEGFVADLGDCREQYEGTVRYSKTLVLEKRSVN